MIKLSKYKNINEIRKLKRTFKSRKKLLKIEKNFYLRNIVLINYFVYIVNENVNVFFIFDILLKSLNKKILLKFKNR